MDEHLSLERSGSSHFYHADGLGSITAVTDANGNMVQSYDYDSFGGINPSKNFRNSYSYTGREWDKEIGLYYYRARYYDPIDGRFISKDPISFAGGNVNLYGYVQNNSVNLTDPSGLIAGVDDAAVAYAGMAAATAAYATYRTNANKKGSIPNYKKPRKPGQCSYNGPPPDGFDQLKILAGTSIAQFFSDFIEGVVPGGAPPPTFGGLLGNIVGDALEDLTE